MLVFNNRCDAPRSAGLSHMWGERGRPTPLPPAENNGAHKVRCDHGRSAP
jgi:hypothetical protein